MDWLFQTDGSYSYVILRFGLAVTFFMHGTQHAFGWHGGKGAKAQVTNWRDKYHIPLPMGFFALFIELFAVFAMTFGFLVRPAAFGLAVFIGFALDHVVAECTYRERHNAEKDHDGSMHGSELIVELREHDPFGHAVGT